MSYEGSTLCLGVTKFLTVLCVCHIYPSFALPWPWILFLKYLWCFVNTLILFETQHRFHQFHLGFSHPSSKPRLDNAFLHCFSCSETVPKGTRPTAEKPVCRKKKTNKQHFAKEPALELVLSFSLTPNSMKTLTFYVLLFLTPRTGSHEKLLACFDHINSNLNLFFPGESFNLRFILKFSSLSYLSLIKIT